MDKWGYTYRTQTLKSVSKTPLVAPNSLFTLLKERVRSDLICIKNRLLDLGGNVKLKWTHKRVNTFLDSSTSKQFRPKHDRCINWQIFLPDDIR